MNHSKNSVENNSPYAYCLGKALPDGSNLYYANLYERDEYQPMVVGLHALLQELYDVLLECSDPGVARLKFRWWQEELDRLEQEQARHPISTYLQVEVRPGADEIGHLREAVAGFERLLMLEQPTRYDDSLELFKNSAGQGWRCYALLVGIRDVAVIANIEQMAAAYYLLQSLQHPAKFMTESCCVVPSSIIKLPELQAAQQGNNNPAALRELTQRIIDTLETCYQRAGKEEKKRFKHGLLLNRLALKTAQEIKKSDSRLLSVRVSLTPVRKLFVAWSYRWLLR